ncbi:MAG: DUF1501 domain-containing protein [Casimicrobiaceae bacterium]
MPLDFRPARRRFLRSAAGLAGLPLVSALAESAFAAGPFSDYRAMVCIFLFGGSDSHNVIVPTAAAELAAYAAKRGTLAIPPASLVPISPTNAAGRTYATHPSLPKLAQLFNVDRKLAFVGNVGVLIRPTTIAQYNAKSVPLPPQLFSHSDMQSHWQSANPSAPFATGWGGRMAELLVPGNAGSTLPLSVSLSGSNQLMVATLPEAAAYQVATTGPIKIRAWRDWDVNGANPQKLYQDRIVALRSNRLEDEYGDIVARSMDTEQTVTAALAQVASFRADFPGTGADAESSPTVTNRLADQLRMIARLIAARGAFGAKRQIFFASLGGFDTHGDETTLHPRLLAQLDDGLDAFYRKTVALGVGSGVTAFTASDFGRTYTSNGSGSDHGWGGHHIVVGGAVTGGALYGGVPVAGLTTGGALTLVDPATGSSVDVGQGRLLPSVATDVYGATLARWMGVTQPGELSAVFPNLGNFAATNLGFLG